MLEGGHRRAAAPVANVNGFNAILAGNKKDVSVNTDVVNISRWTSQYARAGVSPNSGRSVDCVQDLTGGLALLSSVIYVCCWHVNSSWP